MDADTKQIARQRVQILFQLAQSKVKESPNLAERYVKLARKIAMAAKIRLPPENRRQICRHCKSYIIPGVNCTVRLRPRRESHIVITCQKCGGQMRIPTKQKGRKP